MAPRSYGLYLSDLRRTATATHGTINYALGLAAHLPALLEADERLVVYANDELAGELEVADRHRRVYPPPREISGRLWSDHVLSTVRARRDHLDLLHFPKGHLPLLRDRGIRLVATLHDDIPAQYATGRFLDPGRAKARYFAWTGRRSLRVADRVLTVSEFSRRRLLETAPETPASKVIVTYEGITLPERPFVPLPERRPELVLLGSRLPHKRTAEAIDMALRLFAERPQSLRLVVLGSLGPDAEALARDPRVERVERVLTNREMADLLAGARGLLFNSEYEGFGLPPVEAYALGTPAVYALAAALPEVMDGAPGGYSLGDYRSFVHAFEEVMRLGDEELLSLRERFRSRYSWPAVAGRTLDVYREVVEGR